VTDVRSRVWDRGFLAAATSSPGDIPWFFESPLCTQLEVFGMHYNVTSIASWQAALDRADGFAVPRIGFGSFESRAEARLGFQMTLARADGGDWSRVVLRRPPTRRAQGSPRVTYVH
jgi:hypothetical protein